jgi:hypothetical protein
MLPLASRSAVQRGVQVLAQARRIASVNAGIMPGQILIGSATKDKPETGKEMNW